MVKSREEKIRTKEKPLLKPKNDVVFQSLFSKKNEKITKAFVEALLEEKVENILINEEKELIREYAEDKLGILDLEVDVNGKEKVDIEIQLIKKEQFVERLIFYFSKLYTNQIKKGNMYRDSKRVVIIAIIDYELELTKKINKMETKWKLREDENTQIILTEKMEIRIIELKKIEKEYIKDKINPKNQWIMFLNNPEDKEVEEIMKENEEVKEAVVKVRKMSEDEKMRRLADLREKAIMDEAACYDAGVSDGIKKGIKQGENKRKNYNNKETTSYEHENRRYSKSCRNGSK